LPPRGLCKVQSKEHLLWSTRSVESGSRTARDSLLVVGPRPRFSVILTHTKSADMITRLAPGSLYSYCTILLSSLYYTQQMVQNVYITYRSSHASLQTRSLAPSSVKTGSHQRVSTLRALHRILIVVYLAAPFCTTHFALDCRRWLRRYPAYALTRELVQKSGAIRP